MIERAAVSFDGQASDRQDWAVRLDAVSKHFGSTRAVDELSLAVPRGTLFALLGPNGAGKTTTITMCEGFVRPDSGTIRVLDQDPWAAQATLRPRIGVMLQAGGAHGSARAGEMLRLVAHCAARPHDPDELLDMVGLTAVARTPVRRLSGGQVQRLSLAMSLVGRPELLFLDEPTAGMDPQARHLVWDVLRAARSDGVTIVLTTHLLDEVELLADDVVIIDHGRAIAHGSPAELTGATTEIRFTTTPGLDLAALAATLPDVQTAEVAPGQYRVAGDLPPDAAASIALFVTGAGAPLTNVETGRRTLDDVYLELTGEGVRS
ncbi:MAG: ABC transporter ATP-binding protein [Nakamurella sp.]